MSPIASGPSSHTQITPTNGVGPIRASNVLANNSMDGAKGLNRVLPHLDDLVGVRPDVDRNTPFRTILQIGESLAKQADTHLDFRRPDIALQDYIKASIIAIEILPRHKDYSSLQADRPELHRQYVGLNKRINAQHSKFAQVKETVKENNARSGVKPVGNGISAGSGTIRLDSRNNERPMESNSMKSEASASGTSTSRRPPPPVQPKPDALHGRAIAQNGTSSNISSTDLATRFARLRSPESNTPVQDPRIRTQPIIIPNTSPAQTPSTTPLRHQSTGTNPIGPRELPSVPTTILQQPKISVNVNISAMPRPPDAIYSPDRGVESGAAANLKSSSSFSNIRKFSAPPISTVGPTPLLLDERTDYFSSLPLASDTSSIKPLKRKSPSIPDSTTLSAEDLLGYLGQGSQSLRVLLVDLRSREDFESGHIMSQSIICVEPITLRQGISGDELGDSMVIAPDSEQELYQQRHEFDLVVVYDQDSTTVKSSDPYGGANKLQDFMLAVYDYGYAKRLKHHPVLLHGGLNAWTDLLGPNALQSSPKTNSTTLDSRPHSKLVRPILRSQYNSKFPRRTISSRALSREEEQKWDKAMRPSEESLEVESGDEFVYSRTTEDFFRRYPELPAIQESMISAPQTSSRQQQDLQEQITKLTSKPPTRPPPALPRQRSSGILDNSRMITSYAHVAPNSETISETPVPRGLCGLANQGNTCYLNSVLQAISHMSFLRDALINFTYPPELPIPNREGENKGPNPQLMVRVLGNLLGHLWSGRYEYVRPKTFTDYCASVHRAPSKGRISADEVFGGRSQQDATDYFRFIIDILDDELNSRRNLPLWNSSITDADKTALNKMDHFTGAWKASALLNRNEASLITREMRTEMCLIDQCNRCHTIQKQHVMREYWEIYLGREKAVRERDGALPPRGKLFDAIARTTGRPLPDALDGFDCEVCIAARREKKDRYATRTEMASKLPNYLIIAIHRGNSDEQFAEPQILDFPEYGFDMSPFVLPVPKPEPGGVPPERKGPFLYDIFAVVQHRGTMINNGHYVTFAKSLDQPKTFRGKPAAGQWHRFDDSRVTPADFNDTQNGGSVIFFFRRQGIKNN